LLPSSRLHSRRLLVVRVVVYSNWEIR
jgi:hypothetical protein